LLGYFAIPGEVLTTIDNYFQMIFYNIAGIKKPEFVKQIRAKSFLLL